MQINNLNFSFVESLDNECDDILAMMDRSFRWTKSFTRWSMKSSPRIAEHIAVTNNSNADFIRA
jgi:hypothetical protein